MSDFQLNFSLIKEPLGFIKILEWIFAIFAFATCGGYSDKSELSITCKEGANSTVSAAFSYPFRLNKVLLKLDPTFVCNQTVASTYLVGDFSSSAEFFVTLAVLAFLYCIGALVFYVGYLHLYREARRGPKIDFIITVLFACLWLISSSAWAKGLTDVKQSTNPSNIILSLKICTNVAVTCTTLYSASMGKLNVSVMFGFLNVILWGGNAWFVYKETNWHTPPQSTSTPHDTGSVPSSGGM
ncbi:synaptophysin-like protein 1 [Latimeria chalumnae]|nr:PREDICTED: synaptophysin-like protein 1 [Latimeria chalumnae]|eukprot:XP_006006047.1 PREDICTED: synaptophysin-like protein 1 [Latimeria chalumnae]